MRYQSRPPILPKSPPTGVSGRWEVTLGRIRLPSLSIAWEGSPPDFDRRRVSDPQDVGRTAGVCITDRPTRFAEGFAEDKIPRFRFNANEIVQVVPFQGRLQLLFVQGFRPAADVVNFLLGHL